MIIFDEEYKLVLAFYLFDKSKSNDSKEISVFTNKLSKVTMISRSAEIIKYMLSSYKMVDPIYNTTSNNTDVNFKDVFLKFTDDINRLELKKYYKKFKDGLLDFNDKHLIKEEYKSTFISDIPKTKTKMVVKEIMEYPRDNQVKINSLIQANYRCEIDDGHVSFTDRDGNQYMEGHHLIPLKAQRLFNSSLDVEANVVCLCPNCHRMLHHGEDFEGILQKIFLSRLERLRKCELNISFDELKKIYIRGL